jgi:hypothetical protein
MYYPGKLRQDIRITGLIPAIVMLILFGLAVIFFNVRTGIAVVSFGFIIYSVFSLFLYSRTRNISYMAAFLFHLFFGLYLATCSFGFISPPDTRISSFFQFSYIITGIWLIYLLVTRKTKWKGREVFELAARSIDTDAGGFTERPLPSGKMDYTKDELLGLAEFLKRNLVAMPHREDNRVVFIPVKMGDEFNYIMNPVGFLKKCTWISFDFQGNVTVNISKRDYLDYKEEFAFDQLCDNLGKLFMGFMAYYQKGEAGRILVKLNEMRIGLFS